MMKRYFLTILTFSLFGLCLRASGDGQVDVAFGAMDSGRIVGAVESFSPSEIAPYFTDRSWKNMLRVAGMGSFGVSNVRGEDFVVVVDGLIRDGGESFSALSDKLNTDEIESVTILKDAASRLLYGAYADQAVLMITTRRGRPNRNEMNLRYESDFGIPVSYPGYLGTSDYMILYNEALKNDGLATRYSYEQIEAARNGGNGLLYPSQDYYSSDFLSGFKPQTRLSADFSGGNNTAQYFLDLSWYNTRSIIDYGQAKNQHTNCFNARGNVDVKVNDWLKISLDAVAVFNSYNGVNYASKNFWNLSTSERVNSYPFLIPIGLISPDCAGIVSEAESQQSLINGAYLLGGDTSFTQNIYGDLLLGGYANTMDRMAQMNVGIDIDLGRLTPGLKFNTYFGSDNYNRYTITQANSYAVYTPTLQDDGTYSVEQVGVNDFIGQQKISDVSFFRRIGWYNTLAYKRIFGSRHDLDAVANTIYGTYTENGTVYMSRYFNTGLRANYVFDGRYVTEYSGALICSSRFAPSNRWGYAQAFGAGYIVSDTDGLYLKAKATWALSKTDIDSALDSYHLFENTYASGSSFAYGDGAGSNNLMAVTSGAEELGWITKKDLNLGLEGSLCGGDVTFEADWYYTLREGEPVKRTATLPRYLGGARFIPYSNFGSHSTTGIEFKAGWSHEAGDWKFALDGRVIWYSPRTVKFDELDYGEGMEYYQRAGKASDGIWGLTAEGLYTQEEIDMINDPSNTSVVRPSYGTVRAGDIKYRDMNGDLVIDDYDRSILGHSHVRFNYGLNLRLSWKNLGFWAYLFAQTGGSRMYSGSYWIPSGEAKYPVHILNRWAYDPSIGVDTRDSATYPRLTTQANANNSEASTFWIGRNDYFSIPAMQLTYTFPKKGTQIYLKGQDLLMAGPNASKIRLNIGSEPQYRTVSLGAILKFQ